MTPRRKQRLILTLILFTGTAVAITLALLALRENINLFFAPSEVQAGEAPRDVPFRLGGMVVAGSIQRSNDGLNVQFDLTDTAATVTVIYRGILPDLFGEGQGVVTQGRLLADGTFRAEQVLAKHDETYMPPEVNDALEKAQKMGLQ